MTTIITLTSNFVTGLTDAEGCFMLKFSKTNSGLGWRLQLIFTIQLHKKDLRLLEAIQKFFKGVGTISISGNMANYGVRSLKDLLNVIIPHFDIHLLVTQKGADYILFRRAAMLMKAGKHLTLAGLHLLVAIRASMNWGLSAALADAFPGIEGVERPIITLISPLNPDWVTGFISGDGGFSITWHPRTVRDGVRTHVAELFFHTSQHPRDSLLMNAFIAFFGCGNVGPNGTVITFRVSAISNIQNIIIPFFIANPIQGVKALDFSAFVKAAEIFKANRHLTDEGYTELRAISNGMNRKRRENRD